MVKYEAVLFRLLALLFVLVPLASPTNAWADKWLSLDKVTGRGVFVWDSGARYEGGVLNNTPHGVGIIALPSGKRYEGEFNQGVPTGKGVMTWPSGIRYEGEFNQGEPTGKGVMTWPNGQRYEGDFVNGKYEGTGVMQYADGGRYEGGWLKSKRAGLGVRTFPSGQKYQGGFVDDKYSGKGVYLWPSGQRYEGDFVDGKYHGYGVMLYEDGDRYAGQWENHQRLGKTVDEIASKPSSNNSGQWIAGMIGMAVIGSAPGLGDADKVRMAGGFLSDVVTDGKGEGIRAATQDIQNSHNQSAAVQAAMAEQQRLAQESQRRRVQAEQQQRESQATALQQQQAGAAVDRRARVEPTNDSSSKTASSGASNRTSNSERGATPTGNTPDSPDVVEPNPYVVDQRPDRWRDKTRAPWRLATGLSPGSGWTRGDACGDATLRGKNTIEGDKFQGLIVVTEGLTDCVCHNGGSTSPIRRLWICEVYYQYKFK